VHQFISQEKEKDKESTERDRLIGVMINVVEADDGRGQDKEVGIISKKWIA
jgi:hypothetical protein